MIVFALIPAPLRAQAAPEPSARKHPKVLILHSYSHDYIWCQHITQGVIDTLHDLEPEFRSVFMDAKNRPSPSYQRSRAKEIIEEIKNFAPDIVIAADDAAQRYVVEPYLKGTPVQVVFCGVNANPAIYGFPGANVSGVRERYHCRDGFKLLKRIAPNVQNIAFVAEDSESGRYVIENLREEEANGPFAVHVSSAKNVRTYQQFQAEILRALKEDDAIALGLYQSLVDEMTDQVVPPATVMAWTNSVMNKPTLGFSDPDITAGVLCGVLESAYEQGRLAANMARTVLSTHVQAGTLPVTLNDQGLVLLNLRTAERLGLTIPYEFIESAGLVVQ